jgi:protein arginine kinase
MSSDPLEPNILVSTRVRLARNLVGWPFPHVLTPDKSRELEAKMAEIMAEIQVPEGPLHYLSMESLRDIEKRILVEKHLMSPDFAEGDKPRALFLSKDHRVSIMVNEEDHVRIQVLEPKWNYSDAWQLAAEIDDLIDEKATLAFHKKYGYLTACPTNVGTGLRLCIMVHLPGLSILGQVREVTGALTQMGLAVRGLYGEKSKAHGNLYQISNQNTLGKSEEDIMRHLDALTQKIVEKELQARQHLAENSRHVLEDRVWRARGVLQSARLMSMDEAFKTLSLDRLGMDMGILPGIRISYIETLVNCLRGALQMSLKDQGGSPANTESVQQPYFKWKTDDTKSDYGESDYGESNYGETDFEKSDLEVERATYLRHVFE